MRVVFLLVLLAILLLLFVMWKARRKSETPHDHYVCDRCGEKHCTCDKADED